MNKKILPQVELTDIGEKGLSVGKFEGKVVFVAHAIPGDVVDVEVQSKKKRFYKGISHFFHKYSEMRVSPLCIHFGTCGGCKWQHLDYSSQLDFKQKQIKDHLSRLGNISLGEVEILPIVKSKKLYYYRNKLEFSFSNSRWLSQEEIASEKDISDRKALGFHIPSRWDKVLDLNECHLQEDPSNEIRLTIRDFAKKEELSFFDPRKKEGFLRNLLIRISSTGEIMILLQFYFEDQEKRALLLNFIKTNFPQITSLLYVINEKANDSIYDRQVHLFCGRDFIYEQMENLKFRIGAKTFYQTNSHGAYELYKVIRDFALPLENTIIYDMYCGIGTIGQFLASGANKIIGIELIEESIALAKINAKENKLKNCYFFLGDTKEILTKDFIKENGFPDLIIVDPPREGLHQKVIEMLLEIGPKKMIYVSCNSATQARDLALLKKNYKIKKMQAVDLFPQTHHIENVVLLEKNHEVN